MSMYIFMYNGCGAFKRVCDLSESDSRTSLEHSLAVVNDLRNLWESTALGWSCVFPGALVRRTQDWRWSSETPPSLDHSLAVVNDLRASANRTSFDHKLFYMHHCYSPTPQLTTASGWSKEVWFAKFLNSLPLAGDLRRFDSPIFSIQYR